MNLKTLQNLGDKYAEKFKEVATAIINDEVITDEDNKKTIIMLSARDMAMGAALKRSEHILTGVGIGVIGTALAFTIGSKIKNKKKDVVVEFDMDSLNKMEEVLKEQKKTFDEESATTDELEEKQDDEEESIMDKINDILKKPSNLEDLKSVIEELRKNEK